MYNDSFRKRYGTAPVAISENLTHYDTAPHIHREIEILYIIEGQAQITVSDRVWSVRAGDFVFVNPMDVHSVKADRALPYHQRCICFDAALLADKAICEGLISGEYSVSGYYSSEEKITAEVKNNFERLFSSVSESSEALLLESAAYASLIFAALKRYRLIISKKKNGKKMQFSRSIQEYLEKHFTEQITSLDMARALFYTQSYFCRRFREEFGVPFLEYLTMYRISRAKSMLASGEKRISEVALEVGFFDPSYFSKCFRGFVGVSPSEYQKSQSRGRKKSI